MSPDCEQNPEWAYYPKHRKATCASWDNGVPHEFSAQGEGRAQYNPHFYGSDEAVRDLEMKCYYAEGIPLPGPFARYMQVDHIVGVCLGEETQYVYVECISGFVHDRPISRKALKKRGVDL